MIIERSGKGLIYAFEQNKIKIYKDIYRPTINVFAFRPYHGYSYWRDFKSSKRHEGWGEIEVRDV